MNIDKTCRQIAKQFGEDKDLVKDVIMYQFKFIQDIMKDENDTHDIMINKAFRFKLKKRFKDNKQANYSPNGRVQ